MPTFGYIQFLPCQCVDSVRGHRNFDDINVVHSTLQRKSCVPLPLGLDRPPRIAVWRHQGWEPGSSKANPRGIGDASQAAMEQAVALLRQLGAIVDEVSLPPDYDDLCDQHTLICNDGLARGLAAKTEGPGTTPAHLGMDLYHTYTWHGGSRYPMMSECRRFSEFLSPVRPA